MPHVLRSKMRSFLPSLSQYRGLLLMILVLGPGGTFPYGFHLAVTNAPSKHIRSFLNATWAARRGAAPTPETLTLLWSSVISIFGLGGILGCLCSQSLVERFGKKKCLLFNNLFMLGASGVLAGSKMAASFEMALAGRLLIGFSSGVSLIIHPIYAGEIAPRSLRGFTNASVGIFVTLGKVFGQVLGLRELLGTESLWPCLLGCTGVTALLQLVTLPFFPESPRYLLMEKGDQEACWKAVQQLWGPGDHKAEVEDMRKEQAGLTGLGPRGPLQLLRDHSLRRPVSISFILGIAMQFSGINAIYFYASEVLQQAGFSEWLIPYVSMGIGICDVFSSVLCTFIIEQFSRRGLLLTSYFQMTLLLLLLTITLNLQSLVSWMALCSAILLFLFIFFFSAGAGEATRPAAMLIMGMLLWGGNFLLAVLFPLLVATLGSFCFLVFSSILMGTWIFIYLFLPETRGRSIADIAAAFVQWPQGRTPPGSPPLRDPQYCTRF
ncbi:solute carrier family 2, facilitated glucose transporter member 11 isoform X3 [Ornithorhynchus anatinus]|uniref:solute carrier family 2, facilitated glucose transporter member 11 isoform X3 n=1 Tax=Ornithorhynchus anatinus TaxID=9258 RepID=UPI0010A76F8D|nr:solute carrier family 2, facilitated glucose transporter member 11 isoform X3 [Ornithorhynchus anatinus]